MAKQLYDYWFVQFDFPNEEGKPYKSSGGEMVWNEKLRKDIPEYWEVKSLSNWLEIKSGFPFKSETYKPIGRYKIITIKNVQDGELVTSGCDYVNEIPSRAKDYISLQIGDRLISLTGNCGRLCVVCEENLLLNQRVGLLCCDAIYLEYFYNFLNSSTMRTVIDNLANGAAQANLSPVELCKTDYFIPPIDILLSYNRKANAIRKVIVQNNQEISPLTKQRDELLPLLMNGQVSVNSDLSKCISKIGIVALIRNYPNSLLKYWRLVIIYKCRITFSYNFSSHFASLPSPSQISSTSSDRLLPPRLVGDVPAEVGSGASATTGGDGDWSSAYKGIGNSEYL